MLQPTEEGKSLVISRGPSVVFTEPGKASTDQDGVPFEQVLRACYMPFY